jgi:hypothetical protein
MTARRDIYAICVALLCEAMSYTNTTHTNTWLHLVISFSQIVTGVGMSVMCLGLCRVSLLLNYHLSKTLPTRGMSSLASCVSYQHALCMPQTNLD